MDFIYMGDSGASGWGELLATHLGWRTRRYQEWIGFESTGGALWFGPPGGVNLDVGLRVEERVFRAAERLSTQDLAPAFPFSSNVGMRLTDPSGLRLFVRPVPHLEGARPVPLILLNHVAVNVVNLRAAIDWYEANLGCRVAMIHESPTDPRCSDVIADAHLYEPDRYYLTLRNRSAFARVRDHVGLMADSRETVDHLCRIVRKLGWPVLVGPAVIDASYLFHFETPDGTVSDVFFPTSELRG